MKMYKASLHNGTVGLYWAANHGNAVKQALEDEGRSNVRSVEDATDEDIAWVRAMGGYVPRVRNETTAAGAE
jgi:hypothetical protein